MSKKTVLAITLVSLGVVTGLLILLLYAMTGGEPVITLAILAAAIACILTGTILAFSQLLDRLVSPVLEEIHKDIEDDIQDLKENRITHTLWMVIAVGIAALAFSFFVFRFHKLEAMWGPMPVALPAFAAVVALAWFIPRTNWFRSYHFHTPVWVFLIPTAGLIL